MQRVIGTALLYLWFRLLHLLGVSDYFAAGMGWRGCCVSGRQRNGSVLVKEPSLFPLFWTIRR
ncbi:MAG: hypothetical protein PUC59_05645 [Firmicutes bacterium]|nr:hypothetical protein [Bacillota bacterium]